MDSYLCLNIDLGELWRIENDNRRGNTADKGNEFTV